jgi:glycosyltransferase involved in cell wall biosynthesis
VKDGVFYLGYRLPHQVRTIEVPTTFTAEQPLELSFVGTFGKSYDIRAIFEALRVLSPDERSRIRCRLVGKGDYLEHWQRNSRDLPCVSFEGWKDEKGLVEVLASSHVGLIPIKGGVTQFWMGNKLFEYAAFGVALINSVPNEAAMLIEQNDFGINVNPGDSAGIAQALRAYLANPSLLVRHRENARAIFNQKFDAQRIYAEFADHVLKGIRSAQSEDVLSQAV